MECIASHVASVVLDAGARRGCRGRWWWWGTPAATRGATAVEVVVQRQEHGEVGELEAEGGREVVCCA